MEKILNFRPLAAYLELCERSMMELFANIYDSLKKLEDHTCLTEF